jgi:hypothetical protein
VTARAVQWVPAVLFIEPGDTVAWHGMVGHETALLDGMAPAGARSWRSALGAEGFRVTFERAGAYLYTCEIHAHAGMVGAVIVGSGEPHNLATIEAAIADGKLGGATLRPLVARIRRELRQQDGP